MSLGYLPLSKAIQTVQHLRNQVLNSNGTICWEKMRTFSVILANPAAALVWSLGVSPCFCCAMLSSFWPSWECRIEVPCLRACKTSSNRQGAHWHLLHHGSHAPRARNQHQHHRHHQLLCYRRSHLLHFLQTLRTPSKSPMPQKVVNLGWCTVLPPRLPKFVYNLHLRCIGRDMATCRKCWICEGNMPDATAMITTVLRLLGAIPWWPGRGHSSCWWMQTQAASISSGWIQKLWLWTFSSNWKV